MSHAVIPPTAIQRPPDRHAAVLAEAHERIQHLEGAGPDPEVAAVYWRELADWPDWSEWLPPLRPVHPAVLERRDLA